MNNLSDRGTLRGTLQRNSGNYNDLINKPAINGHTLIGNQSGHALGLANEDDIIYVEANPLGPATADLHKILVDDTIYSIPDVVVYGTTSGAIASFDDGGDNKPLKSLKVAINPVQASGTPTPQAPIPIYGWTGANVQRTGKNLINAPDITLSQSGYIFNSSVNLPKGQLTISWDSTINSLSMVILDKDGNTIMSGGHQTPYTFTLPTEAKSARFYAPAAGTFKNIQIELGSNATDYEPYNPQSTTYPITWSEAGEVFGGYIEFKDGEWKAYKTHEIYTINMLKWNDGVWGQTNKGYAVYKTMPVKRRPASSICDKFEYNGNSYDNMPLYSYGGGSGVSTTWTFILPSSITSKAEASAWFAENPTTLTYKLDTPIEISLDTPLPNIRTLLGNNNIWSDTGEILECMYQRDINIALNKALNQ